MADAPSPIVVQTESWLKQHETLIIVAMVLIAGAWAYYSYLSHSDVVAQARVGQAQQTLASQSATVAAIQTQINQTVQQYQQQVASLAQQNAQLAASITNRNTALQTQQQADLKATPSQLLTRWTALVGSEVADAPNAVQQQANGYLISQEAANATVADLEAVPSLKQNVADVEAQDVNDKKELSTANQLIGQQKQQITALDGQLADQTKLCTTELDEAKASARKGKFKWFGIGYVAGFISGVILK